MARELLSARGLEAAIRAAAADADARKTRGKVRDGDNLLLIVRPGGGASWVLQYRLGGKRLNLTLGAWPAVSLKLARDLAGAARAQGVDPVKHRVEAATAQRPAPSRQGRHGAPACHRLAGEADHRRRVPRRHRSGHEEGRAATHRLNGAGRRDAPAHPS